MGNNVPVCFLYLQFTGNNARDNERELDRKKLIKIASNCDATLERNNAEYFEYRSTSGFFHSLFLSPLFSTFPFFFFFIPVASRARCFYFKLNNEP